MHIAHDRAADEDVLDRALIDVLASVGGGGSDKGAGSRAGQTHKVGPARLVGNYDLIELDVEELVDGFEHARDAEVVLELDCDFVVDERFKETIPGGVSWYVRSEAQRGGGA